jgi:hypothetical protein
MAAIDPKRTFAILAFSQRRSKPLRDRFARLICSGALVQSFNLTAIKLARNGSVELNTEDQEKGFFRQRTFFLVMVVFVAFWAFVLWDVISGAHRL